MKLYWARDIREADRIAIEEMGIPSLTLMENAARAVVRGARARSCPTSLAGRVAILCGKGNNGGDGMAVARLLKGAGYLPEVLLLADPDRLSRATPARSTSGSERGGVPMRGPLQGVGPRGAGGAPRPADLVLDALLGTGLGGPVRGLLRRRHPAINASGAFVAAVDIPSGLSGDALAARRPGGARRPHAHPRPSQARPLHAGGCAASAERCACWTSGSSARPSARAPGSGRAPRRGLGRSPSSATAGPRPTRGTSAALLIIAGGRGQSGAAVLAARGALRAGRGPRHRGLSRLRASPSSRAPSPKP